MTENSTTASLERQKSPSVLAAETIAGARTLDELRDLLNSERTTSLDLPDYFKLPSFGGEAVIAKGVWSWDATRVLVMKTDGDGFERFEILPRPGVER